MGSIGAIYGAGVIYTDPLALQATLAPITGSGEITVGLLLAADATLAPVIGSASLAPGLDIRGVASLGVVKGSATFVPGMLVSASASLAPITVQGVTAQPITITASGALSPVIGSGVILQTVSETYAVITMNPKHLGHAQYTGLTPRSIVEFNGQTYLFGTSGVQRMSGTVDPTLTEILTGVTDFDSDRVKYVAEATLTMRAGGNATLGVTTDEDTQYLYPLTPRTGKAGMCTHRQILGRGLQGNSYQLRFSGNEELAEIHIAPIVSPRSR